MLSEDTARIVSSFFSHGRGPSHDELSRMFERANLIHVDATKNSNGDPIGKEKRCRAVFAYALDNDHDAGVELLELIIYAVRSARGFVPTSENYVGEETFKALKEALEREGYLLDEKGKIGVLLLDRLNGVELTNALKMYVERARRGSQDAALVTGTGKDLLEATARHVLVSLQGSYPEQSNFPMTLYMAFDRLGLGVPEQQDYKAINDQDPIKGVEKAMFLLGLAVNRLRNAEGVGHGRPFLSSISEIDSYTAIEAMGIISEYLIKRMEAR